MRRLWPDVGPVEDLPALVAAEERPPPPGRPWLLVNMIASLDGAISLAGRSGGLGGPADKAMFSALRSVADVILVGAGTVRAEGYGPPRASEAIRAARHARGQAPVPRLAVVSQSLELDPTAALFAEAETAPIVLTSAAAHPARQAALEEVAEVLVVGEEAVDLPFALGRLAAAGVRTITCEGGPHLNGHLLEADLVDEWDLTVSPLLVGGSDGRASRGTASPPRSMRADRVLEDDGFLLTRWVRVSA